MSLSAAPTFTPATTATNVLQSQTLAKSTSVVSSIFYVGVSGQTGAQGTTTTGSALSGRLQVTDTYQTAVASTNGCQVQVISSSDGGTTWDTVPLAGCNFVITTSALAPQVASVDLPPGQYKLILSNLDGTNAITVAASLGTTA